MPSAKIADELVMIPANILLIAKIKLAKGPGRLKSPRTERVKST